MPLLNRICNFCKKSFKTEAWAVEHGNGRYCSRSCASRGAPRKPYRTIKEDPKKLIGKKFGNLRVIAYEGYKVKENNSHKRNYKRDYYLLKCDCGNEIILAKNVFASKLSGRSARLSCGCTRRRKGNKSAFWKGAGDISGTLWARIRAGAISRNLSFELTITQAWEKFNEQKGVCALTGYKIIMIKGKGRTASLDRIDSSKGYEIDNIQWVHRDVNWLKGKLSQERFIELCIAVAKYQAKIKQRL